VFLELGFLDLELGCPWCVSWWRDGAGQESAPVGRLRRGDLARARPRAERAASRVRSKEALRVAVVGRVDSLTRHACGPRLV